MNKSIFSRILFVILLCIAGLCYAKDASIVALPDHELGDQTLSISAGLEVPLAFLEFTGATYASNQTIGGTGTLQWNAYLNSFFRIGLEIGFSFTFGPDVNTFIKVPLVALATWLFNYERFEFPFSFGLGADIIKYGSGNLINVALVAKPCIAAFYRYDNNLSFGLNVSWLWNLEFAVPPETQALMGNSLQITPALFYHF